MGARAGSGWARCTRRPATCPPPAEGLAHGAEARSGRQDRPGAALKLELAGGLRRPRPRRPAPSSRRCSTSMRRASTQSLVGKLAYRVPELLARDLAEAAPRPMGRAPLRACGRPRLRHRPDGRAAAPARRHARRTRHFRRHAEEGRRARRLRPAGEVGAAIARPAVPFGRPRHGGRRVHVCRRAGADRRDGGRHAGARRPVRLLGRAA